MLTSTSVARVLVVCHNTPLDGIAERLGALVDDPRVVLVPLEDGVRSPSGPFNRGLEIADARFVSIIGSDDEVEPCAMDSWRTAAARAHADMVIAPVRYVLGSRMPTPPGRPWRSVGLNGVRDRLAYRTAPLGLISRERFGDLRMTPGLASGEDLLYSTQIWFSGARIARARTGDYVVHDDAERVTFTRRPVAADLAAVEGLLADSWAASLSARERLAIATKLWRLPLFGAVHYRAGSWQPGDRAALAAVGARLAAFSPSAPTVLSRADGRLIAAILDLGTSDAELDRRSALRRRFLSAAALVPSRISRLLAREAPLRFSAATWLAGRG